MKSSLVGFVYANCLWLILSVSFTALLSGCTTPRPSSPTASPRVQTLDTALSALKAEFNRDPSKPRLLALFSPTCEGCIYGAKALQHEAQKTSGLAETTELLVVWVSMLETDNEMEGRKAAGSFDFPGVRHFYDRNNEVGRLLRAEQFPNAVREALEILPADHPLQKTLEKKKDLPPEKMRIWDSVLIFPPGVKWEDHTPKPEWWTIQTGSRIEEKPGERKVVFWRNKLPVGSDWYLEAREALDVTQKWNRRDK
jgi:hypothetical protein